MSVSDDFLARFGFPALTPALARCLSPDWHPVSLVTTGTPLAEKMVPRLLPVARPTAPYSLTKEAGQFLCVVVRVSYYWLPLQLPGQYFVFGSVQLVQTSSTGER